MQTNKLNLFLGLILVMIFTSSETAHAKQEAKLISFWDDRVADSQLKPNHSAWQTLLDNYLIDEHPTGIFRFDYDAVTPDDQLNLFGYVDYLQQLDPRQLNSERQKAYWLNLYNATLVLYVVVSEPTNSIRNLNRSNFWDSKRFTIAQQVLSFNDIEHGILRPLFKDPRIHFALNRAALGSANLSAQAYTAENLDDMLDNAARGFIDHPRALDVSDDELRLSRVFKWYQSDFGDNTEEVMEYLKQYLSADTVAKLDQTSKVRYQYDWALNKP